MNLAFKESLTVLITVDSLQFFTLIKCEQLQNVKTDLTNANI